MARDAKPLPLWRRLAWLAGIWGLSVAAVGVVSLTIRLVLKP
jgi:hypothetical protein